MLFHCYMATLYEILGENTQKSYFVLDGQNTILDGSKF